jgi:DMSO reductase family type II enzyme chaperone
MPTPSEPGPAPAATASPAAVRFNPSPRSVFANFKSGIDHRPGPDGIHADSATPRNSGNDRVPVPLQSAIDVAVARSFICRFLAKAFEYPDDEGWGWLTDPVTLSALAGASGCLARQGASGLAELVEPLRDAVAVISLDDFVSDHISAFGHAARGRCPPNEIEYGDLKADPLFQPHRLADLAAFYRAFGLERGDDAAERHDHISIELEFLSVLAAKEAYALEGQFDDAEIALCREAQKKFLREHLGRWAPAFGRRLAGQADGRALDAMANLLRRFVETECARFGVTPGSEDLLLRPVDEAGESLCASCGLQNPPPGTLAVPTES